MSQSTPKSNPTETTYCASAREFATKVLETATRMGPLQSLSVYAPSVALMSAAMYEGRPVFDTTCISVGLAGMGTLMVALKERASTVTDVNQLIETMRGVGGASTLLGAVLLHPAAASAMGCTDAVPAAILAAAGMQMIMCAGTKEAGEVSETAQDLPEEVTLENIQELLETLFARNYCQCHTTSG